MYRERRMTSSSENRGGRWAVRPDATRVRLAHLVSHPIQYQVALLRRIAQEPDIDLTVLFGSDFSLGGYQDDGFGVSVKWDIPLLGGYRHELLPVLRDSGAEGTFSPVSVGLTKHLMDADGSARFDVLWVHGYATVNQMHGILAANALGIPVLVRSDSTLKDRPRGRLKLAAKKAFFAALKDLVDGVLVVGTHNREYWEHHLGENFPLFLMPYSVDNEFFQRRAREARPGRAALRSELGLSAERPVILFASKLQKRKHCDDLIAAYALLSQKPGQEPEPYLLVVGDGEERPALEQQAAQTGLSSIRFCGFRNQSELPRFFDLCSVFVLPSRHEPWGLVVNEVMNAARAVVVSDDVGCQPDLVTDGVEGCVYPVRNVEALAAALRRVLATTETAVEMGQRALARISKWGFEEDLIGLRTAIAQVSRKLSGREAPSEREPAAPAPRGGSPVEWG
jgi:glycosyltransferase involved in cell wall biosynthesis